MTNGSNDFCAPELNQTYPKWTAWDFIKWKFIPGRVGGGTEHLISYKDGWVVYNKSRIQKAANSARIPIDLLAGIAWIEVGGMPDFVDSIAYPIRSYDWSGPDWVDNHLTITKNPHNTSVGSVSIQLRAAAMTLGRDPKSLDHKNQVNLISCLETDAYNLNVVARHLFQLIKHDFPDADSENLSDEQIAITGSRYNRGTSRKLDDYFSSLKATPGSENRKYTEYGRTILRHRERIRILLLRGR